MNQSRKRGGWRWRWRVRVATLPYQRLGREVGVLCCVLLCCDAKERRDIVLVVVSSVRPVSVRWGWSCAPQGHKEAGLCVAVGGAYSGGRVASAARRSFAEPTGLCAGGVLGTCVCVDVHIAGGGSDGGVGEV